MLSIIQYILAQDTTEVKEEL